VARIGDFVLLQMMFRYRHVKVLKTASNLIYEADQGVEDLEVR
jgi:hypothetical protein